MKVLEIKTFSWAPKIAVWLKLRVYCVSVISRSWEDRHFFLGAAEAPDLIPQISKIKNANICLGIFNLSSVETFDSLSKATFSHKNRFLITSPHSDLRND